MTESFQHLKLSDAEIIDFQSFIKVGSLKESAKKLIESTYSDTDFMKRDILDRLLEYIHKRCVTGYLDIPNMAYSTKRMMDRELEARVIELINEHLYPEIILRLLKFFLRNIHDSDSNLYLANLIRSDEIIKSIFETFNLIKKDIFLPDPEKRSLNVKKMQQFFHHSDHKLSSPLDACARLKYILEFFIIRGGVSHIYGPEDIKLSG